MTRRIFPILLIALTLGSAHGAVDLGDRTSDFKFDGLKVQVVFQQLSKVLETPIYIDSRVKSDYIITGYRSYSKTYEEVIEDLVAMLDKDEKRLRPSAGVMCEFDKGAVLVKYLLAKRKPRDR